MNQKILKGIEEAMSLLDSADTEVAEVRRLADGTGRNVYLAWEWADGNRMERKVTIKN